MINGVGGSSQVLAVSNMHLAGAVCMRYCHRMKDWMFEVNIFWVIF